eukprot:IDg4474t1
MIVLNLKSGTFVHNHCSLFWRSHCAILLIVTIGTNLEAVPSFNVVCAYDSFSTMSPENWPKYYLNARLVEIHASSSIFERASKLSP